MFIIVRERNRTETLHQEIQALKKELEETQISCQREMLNLKETKSDYVRQRVEKARQFQVGSIPNTTEEPMPISNTPAELQYATSAPKSRSAFRIDPLDERYRFKEPKATVWTIEEEALATQLQKALDRQMRRGKNRDADHTIAKQERMLVKIR